MAKLLYAKEPLASIWTRSFTPSMQPYIDLCLSLHSWVPFRSTKTAIKLQTLLHLHGSIPSYIYITDGKTTKVNVLDDLVIDAGVFYLMDRGYLDFARLFAIHQAQGFFVTRTKSNTQFRWRYSYPVDRNTICIIFDQIGVLIVFSSSKDYSAALHRVVILGMLKRGVEIYVEPMMSRRHDFVGSVGIDVFKALIQDDDVGISLIVNGRHSKKQIFKVLARNAWILEIVCRRVSRKLISMLERNNPNPPLRLVPR